MSVKLNEFPSAVELMRVQTLEKFRKLNANRHLEVLDLHDIIRQQYKKSTDLVYLAHSLPSRITEFYGDFIQGDVERLVIQADTGAEADEKWVQSVVYENDIKEKIADYGENQSEFGFGVLLGWSDKEGTFHIDDVPADQYFPQADGSVIFATYKKDPKDYTSKNLLLHTQHYQLKENHVTIEHQAFRTDEKGVAVAAYPLEEMGKLIGKELQPVETIDNITELPIRQYDNGRRSAWGFGKSDYHDIMPQLAEINERATHASTQFLKNMDAKMALPDSALDEDLKIKQVEAFIVDKDTVIPQYIINANPLLTEVREHIMFELKIVEWVTCVPMWALTRGASPEHVESLRIQLYPAVRKTLKKRAKIKRALLDMFRIGAEMTDQSEALKTTDITIDFSDPLPVDELSQVQAESEKIRSGMSARSSSMKRVENYNDAQAKEEQEKIKQEDAIAGIGGANNAPVL